MLPSDCFSDLTGQWVICISPTSSCSFWSSSSTAFSMIHCNVSPYWPKYRSGNRLRSVSVSPVNNASTAWSATCIYSSSDSWLSAVFPAFSPDSVIWSIPYSGTNFHGYKIAIAAIIPKVMIKIRLPAFFIYSLLLFLSSYLYFWIES